MKKCITLFVLLLVPVMGQAEILDFEFDGFAGPYRNISIVDQLNTKFGAEFTEMTVILVESPLPEQKELKEQVVILDSLDKLDTEGLDFMYVVSCPEGEFTEGYYVDKETAAKLSEGNNVFRIRFLDDNGEVYYSQDGVMKSDEILKTIATRQK